MARKLSVMLWNMLYKKQAYNPPTIYEYLDQKRKRKIRELRKQIDILEGKMSDITIA